MKRRGLLAVVPLAWLVAACGQQPDPKFSVETPRVETAAPGEFAFRRGVVPTDQFVARVKTVNAAQHSYKLTVEMPDQGGTRTVQVLRERDDAGSWRSHAHAVLGGTDRELITIGDEQWLKTDGTWQLAAGVMLFGGEGDKVEIFTDMLTQVTYQGADEHGHRFAGVVDVQGYQNQENHDHGHGEDDHGNGDDHDDDHGDGQVLAPVTFWSDAQLRIVRLTHALDADGDHGEQQLTVESRTAFGQQFEITPPL